MSNDTGNHTLRLLQEMREETRQFQAETRARFEQLDRIEAAVVGMAYHNVSDRGEVAAQIEAIEVRLERLERKAGLADEPAR